MRLSYLDLFMFLSQLKALIPAGLSFRLFSSPASVNACVKSPCVLSAGLLRPLARSGCTDVLQDQVTKECHLIGVCSELSV